MDKRDILESMVYKDRVFEFSQDGFKMAKFNKKADVICWLINKVIFCILIIFIVKGRIKIDRLLTIGAGVMGSKITNLIMRD